MYFTNINNDELKQFKDTVIPFDFSMSLTSILTSNLFNVEDMGNNLYRICPLFYCKEIISSNSEDKFFGSQCIITIKDDTKETFYRFKKGTNNENETVFDYTLEHYYPSYSLGDDLSMADFNRAVYLLRKNRKHYDNIQIKNDTSITGVYGEYIFDLEDSTVSDEGIIITPTTLENNCTVTLTNPIFHNSSYYLTLTVKKINNINLCPDDDYNIETSTIRVRLVRNMPISIPFDSIELYDIISFDASVEIVHNEPILLEQSYITLSCSSEHIDLGESVTLNAVYYDSVGSLSGKTIVFKDNGVTIGTATTDSNGLATFIYTPASVRSCSIIADYDNTIISNTVNVSVTKLTSSLSLSSNTDSLVSGLAISVSGSLEYRDTPLMGKTVKIYDNNVLVDTVETDSEGEFNTSLTASNNDMVLKAVFEGDTIYDNVDSDIVTINDVSSDYTIFVWEGTNLTQPQSASNPLINPNHDVIIDYGDGTMEISNNYEHTYSTSGEHTIKIHNLTMLGHHAFYQDTGLKYVDLLPSSTLQTIKNDCFSKCTNLNSISLGTVIQTLEANCLSDTGLISIIIPASVSVMEGYVFADNNNLKKVKLKWDSSDEIITYNNTWINNCSNFDYFSIPEGTRSLYTNKNYPANKIVEPVTVSLSASPSTIISSDTSTLSATVLDDDNNPVSGETVTFKENDIVLGTGTTNNNGVATYNYSGSLGVHNSIQAVARTIFWSNSVTVTVVPGFDGLEISADKYTLSYADSDKCTLYAQLINEGSPDATAGVTVSFYKDNGLDFPLLLGTATTDNTGNATLTDAYTSMGVGDVTFYAKVSGILSSEIYIEDCAVFNSCTSNSIENVFNVPSSVKSSSIYGFSSDGWKFGNVSSYTSMSYNLTAPTIPFEVGFTMTELNSTGLTLGLGSSQFISVNSSGKLTITNTVVGDPELNKEYHAKVYGDKIELYKENTLVGSKTVSMSSIGLTLDTGSNRYIRLKNFKIKPL